MNTYKITYSISDETYSVFVQASSYSEALTAIDINNISKLIIELW